MAPDIPQFFLNSNFAEASAQSIALQKTQFLNAQNVEYNLNNHEYRHWLETRSTDAADEARTRSIELRTIESNRKELSASFLHSWDTTVQYYIEPSEKQAELRGRVIDVLCTRSESRTDATNEQRVDHTINGSGYFKLYFTGIHIEFLFSSNRVDI